jgi:hypothetical protein
VSAIKEFVHRFIWRLLKSRFFNGIRPVVCHIPSFLIEGETRRGRRNLSIIIFARIEVVEYFTKRIFADYPSINYLGRKTFQEIPKVITRYNPDVVIANANDSFSEFFRSKLFFVSPLVDFTLDISDSWDAILARTSRSKRKRIRRIQKLGYDFEVTNDLERLKLFYQKMYVPRILKRHEKAARVVSFAECERLFRSGGLLLVKSKFGENISGAIYVPRGDELYIPTLGISNVDQHLTEGGHAALYFLILWAKQQGFKIIDYSICKPFLSDGIFRYKKEWGMKIKPYKGQDAEIYAIKFLNFKEGAREFLLNNPLIISNGDLKGLVLLDHSIQDLRSAYYTPGLSGLFVLSPIQGTSNPQLKRISLKNNKCEIAPTLRSFISLAHENGYEVFLLDF